MTVFIHGVAVVVGFLTDLWLGDPHGLYHPVQAIGAVITKLELWLRAWFPKNRQGEQTAGTVLVALVLFLTGATCWLILFLGKSIHPVCYFFLLWVMSWQILAVKSLKTESMKVYKALEAKDLEGARKAISMIVGRDTEHLTDTGMIKAAVETVAENTSDGVIAPLFYLFLGGPVLGFLYKAVNTMDSMIGYENERYQHFGRTAAKLDDLVNFIPSRIAAFLLIAAAFLGGMDGKGAWRIWRRDRLLHKSPNAAQGESVCAGALGIQLAGDGIYGGKLCQKPAIGENLRPAEPEDIKRANRLLYGSAWLGVLMGTGGILCYAGSMGAIFMGR